jgi:hypothetical protein
MNKTLRAVMLGVALTFGLVNYAAADVIIIDQSPEALGLSTGFVASNTDAGQNFADKVIFAQDELVTDMDIYTFSDITVTLGEAVTLRIRTGDASAAPLESLETINIIDTDGVGGFTGAVRVHVDFTTPFLALGKL